MEKGALRCWPKDIGLAVEQKGPNVTFLHLSLRVRDEISECPLDIFPAMPNSAFSRGEEIVPNIVRVPPYYPTFSQGKLQLRPYIASKFHLFNQVFGFDITNIAEPLSELITEI